MSCHTPKVRAIIDVERCLHARIPRDLKRLERRGLYPGMTEMRARGDHGPRASDELRINIIDRQPHVRAILAVEDQRKLLLIANTQQHQRSQAIRVGLDPGRIHALVLQLLADKAPHMFIADAGDYRRA